jgi:hypothetical protein
MSVFELSWREELGEGNYWREVRVWIIVKIALEKKYRN